MPEPPRPSPAVPGGLDGGWLGEQFRRQRTLWRGLLLPGFSAPLWLDVPLELILGHDPRHLVGTLLGIGLPWLAVAMLRRGRRGDTNRAAVIMGAAAGLTAGLAAGMPALTALLLGGGAWLGTRLLYDGAFVEAEPLLPPPEPPAEPAAIAEARARLARIRAAAARLSDRRLQGVAGAMAGVLDDLAQRPDRLPLARRFLNVHLDGLERITRRLEAGATPPDTLPALLAELERTAQELREHLRREETEALEVQVRVLSDRLRQEGYG
ncbi:5-bromo-4-chloroindolyl phosphate hydrolysis family protein [Caldovatus aquaticus]|uniref:5-bromo-4-chloroindolyl phosphate hydrolysis family protein n=1 Tax=Caldovatus aquaticus TaxID=2865671 RepID=A0ABS7EZ22_9PROT|nr:5-bromo-4-chloroindolyl phosphate hydrolysis family protein [Caldovatus aquaticus]MBW8268605.1 5-bromo-4-chloroindolyl phosphate hydrolysis family protein [Caldovatus aquaticus]